MNTTNMKINELDVIETPFIKNHNLAYSTTVLEGVKYLMIGETIYKYGGINQEISSDTQCVMIYGSQTRTIKSTVYLIYDDIKPLKKVYITHVDGLKDIILKDDFIGFVMCAMDLETTIYKKKKLNLDTIDIIFENSCNDCGLITKETVLELSKTCENFYIVDKVVNHDMFLLEIIVSRNNEIKTDGIQSVIILNKETLINTLKTFMSGTTFKTRQKFNYENLILTIDRPEIENKKDAYCVKHPSIFLTSSNDDEVYIYDNVIDVSLDNSITYDIISSQRKYIHSKSFFTSLYAKILGEYGSDKLQSPKEKNELIVIDEKGFQNKIVFTIVNIKKDNDIVWSKTNKEKSVVRYNVTQLNSLMTTITNIDKLYKFMLISPIQTNDFYVVDSLDKYNIKKIVLHITKKSESDMWGPKNPSSSIVKENIIKFLGRDDLVLSKYRDIEYSESWQNKYVMKIMSFELDDEKQKNLTDVIGIIHSKTELIFESKEVDVIDDSFKAGSSGCNFDIKVIKNMASELKRLGMAGIQKYIDIIIREVLLTRTNILPKEIACLSKPSKGIILHGPPGTGKTTLARNIAQILGCDDKHINKITAPEIFNKWLGESEKRIRDLFEPAIEEYKKYGEKAKMHILIIDEIDAIIPKRGDSNSIIRPIINQFLGLMDGLIKCDNLIIIGITNCLSLIDEAMLRPGRFGCHIEVGLPDNVQRLEILNHYYENLEKSNIVEKMSMEDYIDRTKEFSCADIENIFAQCVSRYFEKRMLYSNILNDMDNENVTDVADAVEHKISVDDFEQIIKNTSLRVNGTSKATKMSRTELFNRFITQDD